MAIYGFNYNSDFNAPVGKRDFNNSIWKNVKSFIARLKTKNIEFVNSDFREFVIEIIDNILVYYDPLYFPGTASYNEKGDWSEKEEIDLVKYLSLLDSKGVKFVLSNVIEYKGLKNNVLTFELKVIIIRSILLIVIIIMLIIINNKRNSKNTRNFNN